MPILVATRGDVLMIDPDRGTSATGRGLEHRPTCLAADLLKAGHSGDGDETWEQAHGQEALPSSPNVFLS